MKRSLATSVLFLMVATSGCNAQPPNQDARPKLTAEPNRLIHEKSPYLQQHADNLVDWYPWGDEAFNKAKKEGKPVFLSIGYSTCHWCHVMEEESFMDPRVAAYLKEHFVSIKVDRETRPDVDSIYMNFVQASTGQGGWPLTVFLTPDEVPIYGGTYFPNPSRFGRVGFLDVLKKVAEAWKSDREKLIGDSSEFSLKLAKESVTKGSETLPKEAIFSTALAQWTKTFDSQFGGFQPAPKFPSPPDLEFLLLYGAVKKNPEATTMSLETLKAIALGGIHDHLGGGFHRYSTDRQWLVPHFEKMLYDQAQLISLYSKAYAITADPLYKDAVLTTLSYLDRNMRTPEGAFFSAEDADSPIPEKKDEHAEGAFYVWTYAELQAILTKDEFNTAISRFGITEKGNATGDASGELDGKNVLHLKNSQLTIQERALAEKLRMSRAKRPRPNRDEKVLTEWNAMLVTAYADAGRYLGDPKNFESAEKILAFIERELVIGGNLQRSYLNGSAEIEAFAIDHAQLVGAYLALFEAQGKPEHLQKAIHWQSVQDQKFWDKANGGYFETPETSTLLYRRKEQYDGANLSTASRSAMNLTHLQDLTASKVYTEHLEAVLKHISPTLDRAPTGVPGALSALLLWRGDHNSLIVMTKEKLWQTTLQAQYRPGRSLLFVTSKKNHDTLKKVIPYLPPWSESSQAFECKGFSCGLPSVKLEDVTGRF